MGNANCCRAGASPSGFPPLGGRPARPGPSHSFRHILSPRLLRTPSAPPANAGVPVSCLKGTAHYTTQFTEHPTAVKRQAPGTAPAVAQASPPAS